MSSKIKGIYSRILSGSIPLGLLLGSQTVFAVGQPRPQVPVVTNPVVADSQAFPLRYLELGRVQTHGFRMPGGQAIDLNIDLPSIVLSEVNQSSKFRSIDPTIAGAARRGVIAVSVSSLEMELVNFRLGFGYRSGGQEIEVPTAGVDLNGTLDVQVGSVTMDFLVYDNVLGISYAAATSNHAIPGLNLRFQIQFSGAQLSPELQLKDQLQRIFRALLKDGLGKLVAAPGVQFLPWSAPVRNFDRTRNVVRFGAGTESLIQPGNIFQVYSVCNEVDPHCLELYLGELKVTRAFNGYSEAAARTDEGGSTSSYLFDQIKAGDTVQIKYLQR